MAKQEQKGPPHAYPSAAKVEYPSFPGLGVTGTMSIYRLSHKPASTPNIPILQALIANARLRQTVTFSEFSATEE
jgi:hypothetical protein